MFRKIAAAALIAVSLTVAACADEYAESATDQTQGQIAVFNNGYTAHGANICDKTWIKRDGVIKEAKLAQAERRKNGEKAFVLNFKRGAADFDRMLKAEGAVKACHDLDGYIDGLNEAL